MLKKSNGKVGISFYPVGSFLILLGLGPNYDKHSGSIPLGFLDKIYTRTLYESLYEVIEK